MKKIINIIIIILSITLNIILITHFINCNPYDVNKDKQVNSKDLLDLQLYILERMKNENG